MTQIKNKIIYKESFFQKYFNFAKYNLVTWFHFVTLIISGISPILSIAAIVVGVIETNNFALIWFTNFDTFTYQSNLIVWLFVWFAFWKKKWKIFQTHSLMMAIMVYIFITFTFFNTYDLIHTFGNWPDASSIINTNPNNVVGIDNLYKACSIWNHIINPLFFITFGFISIKKEKKPYAKNIYKFITLSMIYPIIYCTYLIFIPWSGFLDDGQSSYSVYGMFTQTKYNNLTWLWFMPLLSIFPISLAFIWNIKVYFFKKQK